MVVLALLALAAAPARALDGVSFEVGGGDDIKMGRAALQWDWSTRLLRGANWHVGGYWDVALGYWNSDHSRPGRHDELFDFGLTPVLRLQPNALAGPYVEAGLGLHVLSHTSIGDKQMSTAVQFGSHIGVGYRFGAKRSYEVGYRFQHVSNAGIKKPNPGINFHQIRVQYHF
jgi:hypothetical protein